MNKQDKILTIVGLFLASFIIACFTLYAFTGTEPQALIMGVLGTGGLEGILCALIKIKRDKNTPDDKEGGTCG